MSKIRKRRSMLDPGELSTFECKLHPFTTRAGVPGDGTCWIHGILYGVSSEYRKASLKVQKEMAYELRRKITDNLDYETFLSLRIEDRFISQDNCYRKYIRGDETDSKVCFEAFKAFIARPS